MYFPYLRAKQFELIALKEICSSFPSESRKFSPVIEPVKYSSTLKSTLKILVKQELNFNIIINPQVGDLRREFSRIINLLHEGVGMYTNYQLALIIDEGVEISALIRLIRDSNLSHSGITLIHFSEIYEGNIDALSSSLDVVYNLIYSSRTSRRYFNAFNPGTIVSLDDYFKQKKPNAEYLKQDISYFSDEYKYYKQDGFIGFSDFLTIGDNYSELGFLPKNVAIHLSFIDNEKIMIKHFVSEPNDNTSDIGSKFYDAVQKLVLWCNENNIDSVAVDIFRNLEAKGHFPGLGTLKKLSIMHHIELIIKNIHECIVVKNA